MNSKDVVIELMPNRIGVLVRQGKSTRSREIDLECESDAGEWAKAIRRSAVTLKPIISELKLEGSPATVLYRSPTQSTDLAGFGVKSNAEAIQAAILSCADSLPYSIMSAICEAMVIGRDKTGDSRQMHTMVVAEREDVAEAMVYLVKESGLDFQSATPLDAAWIASFVEKRLHGKAQKPAGLYIGEYTSFFAVVKNGTLLFSRRVDLGFETLAASLTRPLTIRGRAESVELTIAEARKILAKHGIPDRDTVVDEARQLTGSHLIPLMQPVLQRFIVELRQSIRFGLDEADREGLSMEITGPGAALGGMAKLIGEEIGVEVVADNEYDAVFGVQMPDRSVRTELLDAIDSRPVLQQLNVMPQVLASERRTAALRRWLWAGSAAAIMFVGFEGFRAYGQVTALQKQADVVQSQIQDVAALQVTGDRLRAINGAHDNLNTLIRTEIGNRVNYRACMQELSLLAPESIRFISVSFERGDGKGTALLNGCAFDDRASDSHIETFIDGLRGSPLFDNVELANVHRTTFGEEQGQRFEAKFDLLAFPTPTAPDLAAATTNQDEATP